MLMLTKVNVKSQERDRRKTERKAETERKSETERKAEAERKAKTERGKEKNGLT